MKELFLLVFILHQSSSQRPYYNWRGRQPQVSPQQNGLSNQQYPSQYNPSQQNPSKGQGGLNLLDGIALMALCEPGQCIDQQTKNFIRTCLPPAVLSLYLSCSLSGTEECDGSSYPVISSCINRKSMSTTLPPFKNCHSFIPQYNLNCLNMNMKNYIKDGGPAYRLRQATPRHLPHSREIEFD